MVDLKNKIRNLIEQETKNGHFEVLNLNENVNLIQQIISSYEIDSGIKQDFSNLPKKGELVFVAAPTGAGKDTLVARLCHKNPEKRYIELNMDIFRHYFSEFIENSQKLTDKKFAKMTNEFSYEIYATIQEILLQEFPGTNIIITGTLRDVDWVKQTFERFKSDTKTDYSITLACLAVPKKESAISVIKRYIGIVNANLQNNHILEQYPGTARYTTMEYHDETFDKFPNSLEFFEKFLDEPVKLNDKFVKLIDKVEVYRRGEDTFNLDEETKLYTSEDENDCRTALDVVTQLRAKTYQVPYYEIDEIAHKIIKNKEYLKSQDTLKEVIRDLAVILNYPEIVKKIDEISHSQDEIDGSELSNR